MIERFLDRLDKVRKAGNSQWYSICPVHNGSKQNLGIKLTDDGKILVNCFSCGAKGGEVAESVGLSVKDLFADNLSYADKKEFKKKKRKEAAIKKLRYARVYLIAAMGMVQTKMLTNEEMRKYFECRNYLAMKGGG